jgi:hypothetical protein
MIIKMALPTQIKTSKIGFPMLNVVSRIPNGKVITKQQAHRNPKKHPILDRILPDHIPLYRLEIKLKKYSIE